MKRRLRTVPEISAEIEALERKLSALRSERYRAEYEERVQKKLEDMRAAFAAIKPEPLPLPSKEEVEDMVRRVSSDPSHPLFETVKSLVAQKEENERKVAELEQELAALP